MRSMKFRSVLLSLVFCLFAVLLTACSNSTVADQTMPTNVSTVSGAEKQIETNSYDDDLKAIYLPIMHSVYTDDGTLRDVEYYEYDEFGRLLLYTCNHYRIELAYDESDRLIEELYYFSGELYQRNELTYDENDLVKEALYDKRLDDPNITMYEYTYDENGNKTITATQWTADGESIRQSYKYVYNSDGRILRQDTSLGSITGSITYEYNSQGNLLKKYMDDGYFLITYQDDLIQGFQYIEEDGDEGVISVVCLCDETGNIIECTQYGRNGFPVSLEEFEYQAFYVPEETVIPNYSIAMSEAISHLGSSLDFIK